MTDKVIERIKQFESVIATLEEKVEELEAKSNRKWETSCKLGGSSIRIFDKARLVSTFATILSAKNAFEEAHKALGVEADDDFVFEGYPYKSWLSDFQFCIERLKVKAYRAKISELKAKINAYTPEELRRDKAFDQMDADMKDLLADLK